MAQESFQEIELTAQAWSDNPSLPEELRFFAKQVVQMARDLTDTEHPRPQMVELLHDTMGVLRQDVALFL